MKFRTYPRRKPSGVQWLGEVPEHWVVKAIKWESPVLRGASPRPIDNPAYFDEDGEYAWVRISDVTTAGMYLFTTEQTLSQLGSSLSVKLQPGALFLSIAGSVGKPCITQIKCCIHDGFVYFPRFKGSPKFLYYLFACGEPYRGLGKLGTQLNLNTDTVGSIVAGFPDASEQAVIATFLDRETERLDRLIGKKQELIERLREKRTALISSTVTRGLPSDAARAAGIPEDPALKPSGFGWLGDIPAHWKVSRLKYVSPRITVGIVVEPSKYYVDEGVPCPRSLNVKPHRLTDNDLIFISPEANNLHSKSKIYEGDLVAVRSGQPGTTAIVDRRFHGANCIDLIIIRKPHATTAAFLDYFLNSVIAKVQVEIGTGGAIQQHFNITTAASLQVIIPPLDEQVAIAAHLDKETGKVDALISEVEEAMERLREYRTALIAAAVTGKIDVRSANA